MHMWACVSHMQAVRQIDGGGVGKLVSHLVQSSPIQGSLWLLLNFVFFTHLGEHPSLKPQGGVKLAHSAKHTSRCCGSNF